MASNVEGESSKKTMYEQGNTFLVDDLSQIIATQVNNESDLDLLSTSNDEFMFSLQDLEDGTQLYYDIDKEQNVTVDDYVKMKFLEHPCPKYSFTKYRDEKMSKINGQVYKYVENTGYGPIMDLSLYKVVYEYAFFIENSEDPLDSSRFKRCLGTIHITKDVFTLAGVQDAVSSMKFKEQSLFWISHELMYGVLGVRPRIPPKADFLVRIKISRLFDNDSNELKPKISKFEETLQSATKAYCLAKTHFNKSDYTIAVAIYRKWINTLENTHLADDEQENEVKSILIKMYLNACLCYNKIDNPQRTCLAMRDLEKLTSIANNPKALFAKGKALMMLHHEQEAQTFIQAALKLDPKNEKILKTLEELKAKKSAKKDYAAQMDNLSVKCDKEMSDFNSKQHLLNKFFDSLSN